MDSEEKALLDAGIDAAHAQITAKPSYPYEVSDEVANVVLICWAQAHIDNGGLRYFFEMESPGGPPYFEFTKAYRSIGSEVGANNIEKGQSILTALLPPSEQVDTHRSGLLGRQELNQQVEDVLDELDREIYADDVWSKLSDYIRANKSHFFD